MSCSHCGAHVSWLLLPHLKWEIGFSLHIRHDEGKPIPHAVYLLVATNVGTIIEYATFVNLFLCSVDFLYLCVLRHRRAKAERCISDFLPGK